MTYQPYGNPYLTNPYMQQQLMQPQPPAMPTYQQAGGLMKVSGAEEAMSRILMRYPAGQLVPGFTSDPVFDINGRQFYTLSIEQDGSRNFETFDYSLHTEPVQPTSDYVSRAEFQGLIDRINQMTTGGTDGIPQPVQEATTGATGR